MIRLWKAAGRVWAKTRLCELCHRGGLRTRLDSMSGMRSTDQALPALKTQTDVEDRPREEEPPALALEALRLTPLREDPAQEGAVRMHHFCELQDRHGNGHGLEALGEGLAARPEERVDDARKTHVDGQEVVEKHALHLLLVLAKEEDLLNGKRPCCA